MRLSNKFAANRSRASVLLPRVPQIRRVDQPLSPPHTTYNICSDDNLHELSLFNHAGNGDGRR